MKAGGKREKRGWNGDSKLADRQNRDLRKDRGKESFFKPWTSHQVRRYFVAAPSPGRDKNTKSNTYL